MKEFRWEARVFFRSKVCAYTVFLVGAILMLIMDIIAVKNDYAITYFLGRFGRGRVVNVDVNRFFGFGYLVFKITGYYLLLSPAFPMIISREKKERLIMLSTDKKQNVFISRIVLGYIAELLVLVVAYAINSLNVYAGVYLKSEPKCLIDSTILVFSVMECAIINFVIVFWKRRQEKRNISILVTIISAVISLIMIYQAVIYEGTFGILLMSALIIMYTVVTGILFVKNYEPC